MVLMFLKAKHVEIKRVVLNRLFHQIKKSIKKYEH